MAADARTVATAAWCAFRLGGARRRRRLPQPGEPLAARSLGAHLLYGANEELVAWTKPVNQKAWLLILPVVICVAFSAILPLMTVVNHSVQDIISPERRVFVGTEWFAGDARRRPARGALWRQLGLLAGGAGGGDPARHPAGAVHAGRGWKASAVLVIVAIRC